MQPIGVAVVGTGYWGRKLTYEYLSAQCNKGNVSLAGVCDSSPSALLFCKEKYSIPEKLLKRRFEDVIGDSKVSAVHIATPNHTHYTLARMAFEAGKDVLVEKPMTLNSREAYELVDLAASRELVLHVGHIFRFNSAVRAAREILKRGAIGKVFYARVQWTDFADFPDRDIIFDLGPHPIDVLNQLLDSWPSQVSGFARAYRNSETHEEVAYGLAEYDNGVFAHLELSWLHPTKVREASIMGSEGALVVDCFNQHVVLHTQARTEVPVSVNNTIESEIDWFVDCVKRRCLSTESGMIGARTVEVLETLRRSMWERPLPISVPVEHDQTAVMVGILQRIGRGLSQNAFTNHDLGNTGSKAYLETMVRLGLLETTPTEYQITEKGLHFLKEYGDFERSPKKDLLKAYQKAPSN